MPGLIATAFEFVPIAIFSAIFFLMVLYIKYINHVNLRSVGSDICLGALFIQISLLAVPVWTSGRVSINVPFHLFAVLLTLLIWLNTVWLLKRKKPSRVRSTKFYQKLVIYLSRQTNIRESFSYILGAFALSISLMMMLAVARFEPQGMHITFVQVILAALTSTAIGFGGYSIYRYLQNEQLTQSFERFSREITRDNVLLTIQTSGDQMHDRDPVQPVVDIIRGSIMKGVLGPSLFGLKILKDSCIELLTTSGMRQHSLNRVTSHFVGHIDDIGKLALRMDEDEAVIESIAGMGYIGECAISQGLDAPSEDILRRLFELNDVLQSRKFEVMKLTITHAISRIGSRAAEKGIETAATRASTMLGSIGASALREKDKGLLNEVIRTLYSIGRESAANSLENTSKQTAMKLRDIGTAAAQSEFLEEALQIIVYLEELGKSTASSKLEMATEQILWSIKDIGVTFGYQRIETGINAAVNALCNVGLQASHHKLDDAVDQAVWSLKEVSRYPISDHLLESTTQSARSFARLARTENDKVGRAIMDIKQYFGTEEADRFKMFEKEYTAARSGAH